MQKSSVVDAKTGKSMDSRLDFPLTFSCRVSIDFSIENNYLLLV